MPPPAKEPRGRKLSADDSHGRRPLRYYHYGVVLAPRLSRCKLWGMKAMVSNLSAEAGLTKALEPSRLALAWIQVPTLAEEPLERYVEENDWHGRRTMWKRYGTHQI